MTAQLIMIVRPSPSLAHLASGRIGIKLLVNPFFELLRLPVDKNRQRGAAGEPYAPNHIVKIEVAKPSVLESFNLEVIAQPTRQTIDAVKLSVLNQVRSIGLEACTISLFDSFDHHPGQVMHRSVHNVFPHRVDGMAGDQMIVERDLE